ncbi:MAG: DUF6560 family protein [Ignavibacteriaceae bacterium]
MQKGYNSQYKNQENNIMSEKSYSIKLRATSMYQIILALLIMVLGIYMILTTQGQSVLWVVYVILGVVLMFRYFNMPKEIKVDEELLTFKNWFGKEKMAYIKDLKKISKRMSYLYVYTEEKRIITPSGFNDLKNFSDDMKTRNSQLEVSGIK